MTFRKLRKSWINWTSIGVAILSFFIIILFGALLAINLWTTILSIFTEESKWLEVPIDISLEPYYSYDSTEETKDYDTINDAKLTILKIEEGKINYKLVFDCNVIEDRDIKYKNTTNTEYESIKVNGVLIYPYINNILKKGENHIEIEGCYINLSDNDDFQIAREAWVLDGDSFVVDVEYSNDVKSDYVISGAFDYVHITSRNQAAFDPNIFKIIICGCSVYLVLFLGFEIFIGIKAHKEKKTLEKVEKKK